MFFIKKIRYEKRFNSIDELINQLNQDRKQIKNEIQLINE
ncbi:MAG: riboflavin kinase [Thomasclavelia spiroformis]